MSMVGDVFIPLLREWGLQRRRSDKTEPRRIDTIGTGKRLKLLQSPTRPLLVVLLRSGCGRAISAWLGLSP